MNIRKVFHVETALEKEEHLDLEEVLPYSLSVSEPEPGLPIRSTLHFVKPTNHPSLPLSSSSLSSNNNNNHSDNNSNNNHNDNNNNNSDEKKVEESIWIGLPGELAQKILMILGDIDMCGYLQMVAKNHPFRPSEVVYKSICESIYPHQTLKKKIQIEKWKLWKNMAIYRPRIRTNGFYCLRTSYTRAPCNDNFWEERRTEFIEVKYYRHMRFYNDGYMLYSMDIIDPWDMVKYLEPGLPSYRKIYEGRYILVGNDLTVEVVLHYCVMRFKVKLLDGDDGYLGKHNMLTIVEHSSVPLSSIQRREQQQLDQNQHSRRVLANDSSRTLNGNLNDPLSHYGDESRVYYPLSSPCSLRFFRQWDWRPILT